MENVILFLDHRMAWQATELKIEPCVEGFPRTDAVHVDWLEPFMCVFQNEGFLIQTAFKVAWKTSLNFEDHLICRRRRQQDLLQESCDVKVEASDPFNVDRS